MDCIELNIKKNQTYSHIEESPRSMLKVNSLYCMFVWRHAYARIISFLGWAFYMYSISAKGLKSENWSMKYSFFIIFMRKRN